MVQKARRHLPKIGGKKLYSMLAGDLEQLNCKPGRDKFFDILRMHNLLVQKKKKFVRTTHSLHWLYTHRNNLKGKKLTGPNQAYVSDITYLSTRTGFVYLFLQTDAWSRMITGWHLSDSLAIDGGIKALEMTLRQCPDPTGVIHHSDRGIQYCSYGYVDILNKNKMIISMTEENHCYENAIAERVNGILKDEFLLDEIFVDKAMAEQAVKQAIHSYNYRRPHWALCLSTPAKAHNAA